MPDMFELTEQQVRLFGAFGLLRRLFTVDYREPARNGAVCA